MPLIGIGALALKAGVDVDDAFDLIRTNTGKTGAALKGLQDDFSAVAKRTPAALGEIAPVLAQVNSAIGATGTRLQTLSAQILEAGRITGQGAISVESITRVFGDWSVATEKQTGTLDKFFRASQLTAVPIQRLAELVVQFGAPLRTLGFSLDESIALFGKFTQEGVNVETTLAGIRKFLQTTAKAGKDPEQAFRAVSAEIVQLAKAGKEAEAFKLGAEQFGAKSFQDLTRAIIEGRFELGGLVKDMNEGKDTILGTAEETKDFGERLQQFKNQAQLALAPLGQKLFPLLEKGIKVLAPALAGLLGVFEALGPAAGPVVAGLIALGPAFKVAAFGIKVFKLLRVAVFNLRIAFFLLRGALLANPFVALVAALVAVGALVFKFRKQIGQFFSELPAKLGAAAGAVGDFFVQLPGRILGFINQGLQILIAGVIVIGIRIVQGLVQGLVGAFRLVVDFFTALPGRVLSLLAAAPRWLLNVGRLILRGLVEGVKAYAVFLWEFWTGLPGRIIGFFKDAGKWLFEAGKAILRGLVDGAKAALGAVGDFFQGIGKKIVDWKGPLDDDKRLLTPAGELIMAGLVEGVAAGEDRLRQQLAGVTASIQAAGSGPDFGAGEVPADAPALGPAAGPSVVVHVAGSVTTERELVRTIREALLATRRANTSAGLA